MNARVISAIFRRNILSYFSNPTGYVFIILFVALSSAFAYWPNEFFNANLANLDQLNRYMPYIMLIFVPAITMGIWADERRQGTDELLLTLPATDLDVVLGKFLAAVGVFSVSLAFSAMCNWAMFFALTQGHPDFRLLFANYIGYEMLGLAMLATGMVASFLTSNLTVSFILGAVFNVPLVAADWADAFTGSPDWTQSVKHWGLVEQFRDFGHGLIGLGAIVYFLMLVVVMLYLCLVLIGRRHWSGGRDGNSLLGHYLLRAAALIVAAASLATVVEALNFRFDATAEKVSSLSNDTDKLIRGLDLTNRPPIVIEAYVSPTVPENYVQTRLNLLNALHELHALRPEAIQVKIVNTEPMTDEAVRAEDQYSIKPTPVVGTMRGAVKEEPIFLGVAVTCGLQKVVMPFFDRGMPIEYELVRSIATVAQEKRKRLGVVQTDAKLFGEFELDMTGRPTSRPRQPIIDELERQYEVVRVDASKPIEKFDVLLAVQPSSLGQPQIDNLVTAIEHGQPTAIFEDPFPAMMREVPGTGDPKVGNPMMGPTAPKGDLQPLWSLLGIEMWGKGQSNPLGMGPEQGSSPSVIWQDWNPYPKILQLALPREFVFIQPSVPMKQTAGNETSGKETPAKETPFNETDPVTSGLQELWFPFPGALRIPNSSSMKFVPLVTTGNRTGTIQPDQYKASFRSGERPTKTENDNITHERYVLAARITGKATTLDPPPPSAADEKKDDAKKDEAKKDDAKGTDKKDAAAKEKAGAKPDGSDTAADAIKKAPIPHEHQINVIVVADIDLLDANVFALRSQAEEQDIGVHLDNIVFVLNALDSLSGDERFVEIRKRRPSHRTLKAIEEEVNAYKDELVRNKKEYDDEYDTEKKSVEDRGKAALAQSDNLKRKAAALQEKIDVYLNKGQEVPAKLKQEADDLDAEAEEAEVYRFVEGERIKGELIKIERNNKNNEEKAEREFNSKIRGEQNFYKFMALLIPPIPPFLVAVFVYFRRRAEERQGVAKSRLR